MVKRLFRELSQISATSRRFELFNKIELNKSETGYWIDVKNNKGYWTLLYPYSSTEQINPKKEQTWLLMLKELTERVQAPW